METAEKILGNFTLAELLLVAVNLILFLIAASFLLVTIIKRKKRIRGSTAKKEYQERINKLLFQFLFDEEGNIDFINSPEFQQDMRSPLFKRVAIKSILALQANYSGVYSRKLEEFYISSGLVKYSVERMNSGYWPHIVEGIRDLSGMNYHKAYPRIVSYKNHPNKMVRIEVLLGMIKMKEITEVLKFSKSELYLNDWVQSNILYTVKMHRINAPAELEELLKSKNKSVILLAVRLINYYKSVEHFPALSEFYHKTKDLQLKREIETALKKTVQIS